MPIDLVDHPCEIIPYLPPRLYKFRFWESQYHKDVLERQHLYLSTPQELWKVGDKDDCLYPIDFPKTVEDIFSVLEAMPDRPEWPAGMSVEERRRIRWQRANLNSDPATLAEREKGYFENHINKLRILSMTQRFDNEAMWDDSTYGSFEKGFCVGIDPTHLIFEIFGKGINGNLCEYVPRGSPPLKYVSYSLSGADAAIDMSFKQLHRKYDDFTDYWTYIHWGVKSD